MTERHYRHSKRHVQKGSELETSIVFTGKGGGGTEDYDQRSRTRLYFEGLC